MDFAPNFRRRHVPPFAPDNVKDGPPGGVNDTPARDDVAAPSSGIVADNPRLASSTSLLPDLSAYDLTIGEALGLFTQERRKRPSDRTLQRYCQDGRFDCYKLKTTRNGNPVHEWIINSASLFEFIHSKPIENFPAPMAAPIIDGDANESVNSDNTEAQSAGAVTTPDQVGDAEPDLAWPRSAEIEPAATATPSENGNANLGTVSRVELLVENAKMTARLDSQNELIGELREDKKFMREQITHNRQNDTLMSDMHRETLQTLKAVSVAGRHTKIEMPPGQGDGAPLSPMRDAQSGEVDLTNSGPDGV